jgi:hypothetical protein
MQVAVAFAHEALRAATQKGVLADVCSHSIQERRSSISSRSGRVFRSGTICCEILLCETQDPVRRAKRAIARGDIDCAVEAGDLQRERIDLGGHVSSPCSISRLASASCGNSRIFTAYSSTGPEPPMTGASKLPVIDTTSR